MAAALLLSVSGLAYQGSSGASVTTCSSTVPPGGSTCVVATFTTNGQPSQGDNVVFSQRNGGGNGCTVTFAPSSGVTDQNGQARSTATIGSTCHGTVDLCATDTVTNQGACAAVLVKAANGNGGGGGGGGGGNGHNKTDTSVKAAFKSVAGGGNMSTIDAAAAGALLAVGLVLAAVLRRRSTHPSA
ncbi:MAG TPA: hypothetical protein VF137_10915 [Candidatus Dormibacteraeota bacterium]